MLEKSKGNYDNIKMLNYIGNYYLGFRNQILGFRNQNFRVSKFEVLGFRNQNFRVSKF